MHAPRLYPNTGGPQSHGPDVARIDYDEDAERLRRRVENLVRGGFDFYGRDVDQPHSEFARLAEEHEAL